MNIPAIAQRAVQKAFGIAGSVMPSATFVLRTALNLNPALDTIAPTATKKTVPVLGYRDKWRKTANGNVRTDILLVQTWLDGTPTPTVNDYVEFGGLSREIASVTSDPSGATWEIELVAPSGLVV